MPDYSIWIVEYARVEEYPVSWILYGARNEGNTVLPYCYAVLQSDEHLIVIDSGLQHGRLRRGAGHELRRVALAAAQGRPRSPGL